MWEGEAGCIRWSNLKKFRIQLLKGRLKRSEERLLDQQIYH